VKNHLQRIFRKLLVFNRTHAVAKFFISPQDFRN
jgi:DNA-binding CsgD family transcriptional regulator